MAKEQGCLENPIALFCKAEKALRLCGDQMNTVRMMKLNWRDNGRRLEQLTPRVLKRWTDELIIACMTS